MHPNLDIAECYTANCQGTAQGCLSSFDSKDEHKLEDVTILGYRNPINLKWYSFLTWSHHGCYNKNFFNRYALKFQKDNDGQKSKYQVRENFIVHEATARDDHYNRLAIWYGGSYKKKKIIPSENNGWNKIKFELRDDDWRNYSFATYLPAPKLEQNLATIFPTG